MKKISQSHIDKLEDTGFCLIESFFSSSELQDAKNLEISGNQRFCLDKNPELLCLAETVSLELSTYFNDLYFNRSILFNKSIDHNWSVLWHQDQTVCVKEKVDTEDYSPWSLKEGIHHVQPPLAILEKMVTVRIFIDSNNAENGALKVIPFSHKNGVLSREKIHESVSQLQSHTCEGAKGSILLMKPLILHSSESTSANTSRRRVLHLEFLTSKLNEKLKLYHS